MKVLTRQELIDVWSKQSPELLKMFVCPECRDLLFERKFNSALVEENIYYCWKDNCTIYNKPIGINKSTGETL